jgi:MFS family permease
MNPAPDPPSVPTTQEQLGQPTWVRWQIVGMLVGYSFMTWFNRVSMSVAYDEKIKAQTDISEEAIGYVYSAFLFAYMLFMTPGGWLIDRYGPWIALVVMGLGSAGFGALTGVPGYFALSSGGLLVLLLVIRSTMGTFTAPVYPAASRAVFHWIPLQQRALANGLVQGAAALGIAFAFPIFGTLIDEFNWPTAFLITGALTAALALVWMLGATDYPQQHRCVNAAESALIVGRNAGPGSPSEAVLSVRGAQSASHLQHHDQEASGSWRLLLTNRSLIFLTLSYAAVGYIEYLFFFWMHYYFEKILEMGVSESRLYSMILFLSMAAGMASGGWLSDRLHATWGYRWARGGIPVIGMVAGAGFLCLGLLAHETIWIVTWLALAIAAVGACEAPIWTTAVELGGPRGGTAAGICNTGGNAGGLIAPVLTPLAKDRVMAIFSVSESVAWQWAIFLSCVICLCGAALWIWIDPRPRLPTSSKE